MIRTDLAAGRPSALWAGITDDLAASLRGAVSQALQSVTETVDYEILAQNNEGSVSRSAPTRHTLR